MNRTKTFLLMVVLTVVLVALGSLIGGSTGGFDSLSPGLRHELCKLLVLR